MKRLLAFPCRSAFLLVLGFIQAGSAFAAPPTKPLQQVPPTVVVVGMRGRSVCLQNRGLVTIFLTGGIGAGVQNAATAGTRVSLVDALTSSYPDFRPERVVADEIAKYLRTHPTFGKANVQTLGRSVEIAVDAALRKQEEAPFIGDWQNRSNWILAESRWLKSPLDFTYLQGTPHGTKDLLCVELMFGKVTINQGTTVDLVASLRIASPDSGHVLGNYVNVLEFAGKIKDIRTAEGVREFETEFRRLAADYAKRLVDRALK